MTVTVTVTLATATAALGTASAVCLLALQCGDAYFTAAYFHTPGETLVAAFLGFLLCQAITLAFLCVPASRSLAAQTAALAASSSSPYSAGNPADTVPLTASVHEMAPA